MKTLSTDAINALASLDISEASPWPTRIEQQLDRNIYREVNAALEEIGGAWSRSAKAHLFASDPRERVEEILLTGEYSSLKKDFNFFETPAALATALVQAAKIEPGMLVLEPSAGRGALISAIHIAQPSSIIWAIELHGDNYCRLIENCQYISVSAKDDFTTWKAPLQFDRAVMNPPFARLQDIDHVNHAYACLKPGGRLAAIMSAGWTFRECTKANTFRRMVDEFGSWVANENGAFKSSGTNVRTTTVILYKPNGEN